MTTTPTLIGPNPNTTPSGRSDLFAAARDGRATMRRRIATMRRAGTFTDAAALDMLAMLDDVLPTLDAGTPARYRVAAARAQLVAATRLTPRHGPAPAGTV